jgi:hypothetical protein
MPPRIDPGSLFECRVARLLNREGRFVRRRVDITRWVHPERVQVTDIDLLALDFDATLRLTREIGECKTTEARGVPKEIDRMLWLVGVRTLASANSSFLAVNRHATPKVRGMGRELGVLVQDSFDLERRERLAGIDKSPAWGAHDPDLLQIEEEALRFARNDRELERVYWFFRSEFWHSSSALGLKRSLSAITVLSKRWVPGIDARERQALSWLMGDAIVAVTISIVQLASDAILLPPDEFRRKTLERLAEGLVPIGQLERFAQAVDKYVLGILERAGVSRAVTVSALGAFAPTPPEYSDSLLEVIERVGEKGRAAASLPLAMELVVAERIRKRSPDLPDLDLWHVPDPATTLALGRYILGFLRGRLQLPHDFSAVLNGQESVLPAPIVAADNAKIASAFRPSTESERSERQIEISLDDPESPNSLKDRGRGHKEVG